MATCTTPQSPQNSTSPQFKLTVTENKSKSTGDKAQLDWKLEYVTHGYTVVSAAKNKYTVKVNGTTVSKNSPVDLDGRSSFTIETGSIKVSKSTSAKNVAFSVNVTWGITWADVYVATKSASGTIQISAKTSYTVSFNANGGTGAPSSQTKWYGTNLTLSSTKPTKTGYSFTKWNTKSDGSGTSYYPGGTYSSNSGATLYAIWAPNTYTVSYNLNGGTGSISNQTKIHNQTLTLTSTKPSRTNYEFVGWNTQPNGGGTTYLPGSSYTSNSEIVLYAIWEIAYQKPTITNLKIVRCDSSGNKDDITGQYAKVTFDWSCFQDGITSNPVSSIVIDGTSISGVSGTTGTINTVIGGSYNVDTSYTIIVEVTDSKSGKTTYSRLLPSVAYPIDFLYGGKGVAIGKVASKQNVFDIHWPIHTDDLIYMGGDQESTTEKSIIFSNPQLETPPENYYHHNIQLFGGNTASKNAFGIYDKKIEKTIIRYDDTDNSIHIGQSEGTPVYINENDVTGIRRNSVYVDYGSMTNCPASATTIVKTINIPSNGNWLLIGQIDTSLTSEINHNVWFSIVSGSSGTLYGFNGKARGTGGASILCAGLLVNGNTSSQIQLKGYNYSKTDAATFDWHAMWIRLG